MDAKRYEYDFVTDAELFRSISAMCDELCRIYGAYLKKAVLYGSYARGDQTNESDIDIALILKNGYTEKMHEQMIDIVVDYELAVGITLSVLPIDEDSYIEWKEILPFYKNIDQEGILLWESV